MTKGKAITMVCMTWKTWKQYWKGQPYQRTMLHMIFTCWCILMKNTKYNIIALLSFCQFDIESHGKKEQVRNYLQHTMLWVCLWEYHLHCRLRWQSPSLSHFEQYYPLHVFLGCIQTVDEKAMGRKPVSSVPPQSLPQFLHPDFCPGFLSWLPLVMGCNLKAK